MDKAQRALLVEEVEHHMAQETLLVDMQYFVEYLDTAFE
jgi:hypothetical protein